MCIYLTHWNYKAQLKVAGYVEIQVSTGLVDQMWACKAVGAEANHCKKQRRRSHQRLVVVGVCAGGGLQIYERAWAKALRKPG